MYIFVLKEIRAQGIYIVQQDELHYMTFQIV